MIAACSLPEEGAAMEAAEAAQPEAAEAAADATDAGAVRAAVEGVGAAAVAEAVEAAAQASVCRLEASAFVAEEKCGRTRPSRFYRALNGHGTVVVAHDSKGIMQL
jgi:hypothetical protein